MFAFENCLIVFLRCFLLATIKDLTRKLNSDESVVSISRVARAEIPFRPPTHVKRALRRRESLTRHILAFAPIENTTIELVLISVFLSLATIASTPNYIYSFGLSSTGSS